MEPDGAGEGTDESGDLEPRPVPNVAGPHRPQDPPTADRYQWMVEAVQEVIFEADPAGAWTYLNPAWTRMLGHDVTASIGQPFLDFVHPDDRQANVDIFRETISSGKERCRFEARYLTADGGVRHLEIHAWILRDPDGTPLGSTGTLTDVTDRRRAEAVLEHRATHDPLTGLPNRALLAEHLVAQVEASRDDESPVTLLFLDLDRFTLVNAGVGHDAGDEVLAIVAARLVRSVRGGDVVARFGGDEFVVVAPGLGTTGARELAARVRAAVGAPMTIRDRELTTTASVGIRVHEPEPGPGAEVHQLAAGLLRDADSAMYQAKESGRDRAATFDLGTRHRIVERFETESLLRRAVGRDELELRFQPQVSVRTGQPVGIEALVRWDHPVRGMVGPTSFIPVAEDTGIITALGRWVLEQVCRLIADDDRLAGYRLSVNISPRQLANGLVADVAATLAATGAAPDRLCLELTETALMTDADTARSSMIGLADLGVRLSLDDFGTGFSSLAQLQRLPLAEVKIDRSFVTRLGRADGRAVVAAIIGMSEALGLETVAEGVEQRDEADALESLGCSLAQGFLYARPSSLHDLPRSLTRLSGCDEAGRLPSPPG